MTVEQLTQQAFDTYTRLRVAKDNCCHSVRRERLCLLTWKAYCRYQRRQIIQFE